MFIAEDHSGANLFSFVIRYKLLFVRKILIYYRSFKIYFVLIDHNFTLNWFFLLIFLQISKVDLVVNHTNILVQVKESLTNDFSIFLSLGLRLFGKILMTEDKEY